MLERRSSSLTNPNQVYVRLKRTRFRCDSVGDFVHALGTKSQAGATLPYNLVKPPGQASENLRKIAVRGTSHMMSADCIITMT